MVLFFYGEDFWRKEQKIKALSERFQREVDPSRINLVVLSAGATDEEALRNALRAGLLFAAKRLVVLKNFMTEGRRKELCEILLEVAKRNRENTTLLLSEDGGKPKKWRNEAAKILWEYLEKNATKEEFKQLYGAKLEREIASQAKAQGLKLAAGAAGLLAVLCDGDLGQSEHELRKLAAFCGARAVIPQDVQTACINSAQAGIFAFLDALGNKDKKALLQTLEEQIQEEEPTALMSRIAAHLRAMLTMQLAGDAGAAALKLHPFQLKKIKAQLHNWNVAELKVLLTRLLALDYSLKRGLVADPATQLTALLARLPQ